MYAYILCDLAGFVNTWMYNASSQPTAYVRSLSDCRCEEAAGWLGAMESTVSSREDPWEQIAG
ncbi:MAG: hypothetical protein EBV68_14370, partial [Betaproteobacteria bacterium]|nr:hypothetical protein [Betaproteobacteria bacterium]